MAPVMLRFLTMAINYPPAGPAGRDNEKRPAGHRRQAGVGRPLRLFCAYLGRDVSQPAGPVDPSL